MTRRVDMRLAVCVLLTSLGFSACFGGSSDSDDDDDDDDDASACRACGEAKCANEAATCDSTSGCREVSSCLLGCDSTDSACLADCLPSGNEGLEAYSAATLYYGCATTRCTSVCVTDGGSNGGVGGVGGIGGGGVGGAFGGTGAVNTGGTTGGAFPTGGTTGGAFPTGGTTGGTATGGASPTGGTPATGGGFPTGGTATGGSAGGGPLTPGSGIHWLNLEGSWADPAAEPNGALEISGPVYAYADSCASIVWNEATRCVSGTLCAPGATFENWGMAVGFDLHNTGDLGTPANTKSPWNAAGIPAVGLAWQVSGTAPGLQVWITNMDPVWNGQCIADDCAIAGPPDGKRTTILGAPDTVLWTGMVKDDWGGTGTIYTFSPSNVLAMQFKLAAVVSGAVPFSFCIDRIGVVL